MGLGKVVLVGLPAAVAAAVAGVAVGAGTSGVAGGAMAALGAGGAMSFGLLRLFRPRKPTLPPPRVLPDDVLNDPRRTLTLPGRIENAIMQSKEQSRSFGVVCLRVADFAGFARELGVADAERAMATAVGKLGLRATDRAVNAGEGQIILCLPLIEERRALEGVAARAARNLLAELALQTGVLAAPLGIDTGVAMYPIDGYRGHELIASAQAAAEQTRLARLVAQAPAPRTLPEPNRAAPADPAASATPRAKPVSKRAKPLVDKPLADETLPAERKPAAARPKSARPKSVLPKSVREPARETRTPRKDGSRSAKPRDVAHHAH